MSDSDADLADAESGGLRPTDGVADEAATTADAAQDAAEPTVQFAPLSDTRRGDTGRGDASDSDAVAAQPTTAAVVSLADQQSALSAATEAIQAGSCIVLPTDTVYGIAADAFNAQAVQRLLDAKGRGRDMPPPVLIADGELLAAFVAEISESARALISAFWPGALTLIFNMQTGLRMELGETGGTIAVRVPDHEQTRKLLRATGPLAVSSANLTGQPAATEVQQAVDQLGETVAVYLDGGPTAGNVPSTIVDFSEHATGKVVRAGAISFAELVEKAPFVEDLTAQTAS